MLAFDQLADGLNHIASTVLDFAVPILAAWALWIIRRYLPKPPGYKDPLP